MQSQQKSLTNEEALRLETNIRELAIEEVQLVEKLRAVKARHSTLIIEREERQSPWGSRCPNVVLQTIFIALRDHYLKLYWRESTAWRQLLDNFYMDRTQYIVSGVCKLWKTVAHSTPELWNLIQLNWREKPVHHSAIAQAEEIVGKRRFSLGVEGIDGALSLGDFAKTALPSLDMNQLTNLVLCFLNGLEDGTGLSCNEQLPSLSHATFIGKMRMLRISANVLQGCPALRHICLDSAYFTCQDPVRYKLKNIQALNWYNTTLCRDEFELALRLFPSLEYLQLVGVGPRLDIPTISRTKMTLANLIKLGLYGIKNSVVDWLAFLQNHQYSQVRVKGDIAMEISKLGSANWTYMEANLQLVEGHTIKDYFAQVPNLITLKLFTDAENKTIKAILTALMKRCSLQDTLLPCLTHISISGTGYAPASDLVQFVKKRKKMSTGKGNIRAITSITGPNSIWKPEDCSFLEELKGLGVVRS